jgi:hypothetical protein
MSDFQRDASGRFLPGHNGEGSRPPLDKRNTLWKVAKRLAEERPLKGLEDAEGNPLAILLFMATRGYVPGVPEDEIKAVEHLPGFEAKLGARSALMLEVSQRIAAIKPLSAYMMPKLSATEIKGTSDTFTSMAEVGRDIRAHAPHVAPPDAKSSSLENGSDDHHEGRTGKDWLIRVRQIITCLTCSSVTPGMSPITNKSNIAVAGLSSSSQYGRSTTLRAVFRRVMMRGTLAF